MSGYDRVRIKVKRAVRTGVLAHRFHQERRCVGDIYILSVILLTPYESAARELPGRVAREFVAGTVCLLCDGSASYAGSSPLSGVESGARKADKRPKRLSVEQRSGPRSGVCDDELVVVKPLLELVDDWEGFLAGGVSDEEYTIQRKHERTGRPLGDGRALAWWEKKLGKALLPPKGGRAKKK